MMGACHPEKLKLQIVNIKFVVNLIPFDIMKKENTFKFMEVLHMNAYIERIIDSVKKRDANEPEFIQTVEEVLYTLEPMIEKHPEYEKAGLLERMVEPERVVSFRVSWEDTEFSLTVLSDLTKAD